MTDDSQTSDQLPADDGPAEAPACSSVAAEAAARSEAAATTEAILFASDSPMSAAKIAAAAELPVRAVKRAIGDLNDRYTSAGASFRIEAIAGGFQMLTLPAYHDVLKRLGRAKSESKLSQAAMETLAMVAYRQPIIRADVEAVRGVACGELLRGLLDKGLVKIVGRADVIGRPMLYGTTRRFLEVFGLASLDDLPRIEELRSGAPQAEASNDAAPTAEASQPAEKAAPPDQTNDAVPPPAVEQQDDHPVAGSDAHS